VGWLLGWLSFAFLSIVVIAVDSTLASQILPALFGYEASTLAVQVGTLAILLVQALLIVFSTRVTATVNSWAVAAETIEGSVVLQADHLSVPARRICARFEGLTSEDPEVEEALAMLQEWDHVMAADSPAAALFEVWYRYHLRPALLEAATDGTVAPEKRAEAVAAVLPFEEQAGDPRADLLLIDEFDKCLGFGPTKTLEGILLRTLGDAVGRLESLLGPDRRGWKWGRLHQAFLVHPLARLAGEKERGRLNVGPAPRGGSGDTVGNTAYRAGDFRQTGGSSFRIVVDVGGWDDSLIVNSPGQSGVPTSRHYADLFDIWAEDGAVPLLYSREKVEAAAEEKIRLVRKERWTTGTGGEQSGRTDAR